MLKKTATFVKRSICEFLDFFKVTIFLIDAELVESGLTAEECPSVSASNATIATNVSTIETTGNKVCLSDSSSLHFST